MNRRKVIAGLASFVALGACRRIEGPAEPVWGKEACAHCAMVLSDRRFGAQLLTTDGDRWFFDDLGCLIVFIEQRKIAGGRAWAHDAGGAGWIDVRDARYAGGVSSPMDFGYEAHRGEGLTWDQVRAQVLTHARRGS